MNNSVFEIPKPKNETIYSYAPGSKERELLKKELDRQYNTKLEIPLIIGGKEIKTGKTGQCICPHEHQHILAEYHMADEQEIKLAIESALKAKKNWENLHWSDRAAVFMKAADLLTTKYRYILNAATMLNQSKNPHQAEIDSTCELADFLRFNTYYMQKIYSEQPMYSPEGTWNRIEYRPMEGFIFAITPFNFTAIGGNLPTAPAMMGNTVLWKPASTSVLSNYYFMRLLQEAGLPDGVINFIPGSGRVIGDIVLPHKQLAGVHFTGSTGVFQQMWRTIGNNIDKYQEYPRIVGETGGKDFVFMHNSACARQVAVALVRGSFEYQGQKCSAVSRAYIPQSKWQAVLLEMKEMLNDLKENTGDPCDFKFFNAVIDRKSYDDVMSYLQKARNSNDAEIIIGGNGDDSKGYFIEPTVIMAKNPHYETMEIELFAPVLTVYVYEDAKFEETLDLCDKTSPYALTGAIFASDRRIIELASQKLKYAAGNFYINDKPTGSVVGQQPFGGGRASGTNDKAGFHTNLQRWVNPRTVKENFIAPVDYKYPFMESENPFKTFAAKIS